MKDTVNNIDLSKELSLKEQIKLFQSLDYFELSMDGDIVMIGCSPYQILHKGRNYEKAIIDNDDKFFSVKYILKPANLLSEIPIIKCESNYNCLHSIDEVEEYYNKEIKKAKDILENIKKRKSYAIRNGIKYGLPKHTPYYLTSKTHLSELTNIVYENDGDMICAKFNDFVNLQESPVGFGKTKEDAKYNLLIEIHKNK